MSVYPFIEAEKRGRRNVTRACGLLKVSRAAFYEHLSKPRPGAASRTRTWPRKSQSVHEESKGRYGVPRVHAELRRRGQRHGRKRVARLMRQAGLTGLAAKRWKKTTIADPLPGIRADEIGRHGMQVSGSSPLSSTQVRCPSHSRGRGPFSFRGAL